MILKFLAMNKILNKILLIVLVAISTSVSAQIIQPEWSKNAVVYEVNVRQFSENGRFEDVTKQIPRLKELGVDVLWIMPIHPIGEVNRKGGMGSYYSVKNYKEVSPTYGSEEDFRSLVETAHLNGMKVIIDWVANHTSWDHEWIAYHPEYYVHNEGGEITTQYDWTDVAKLDYNNAEMRNSMVEAMRHWVSNFDIDGFRCDVAFLVPLDFWEQARRELESIKPMYMLAEMEWNPDINPTPAAYFENAFNASYAWNFMGASTDFAKGKKTLAEMKQEIADNYAKFPAHMHKMYFLTNHDENSWNGTIQEKYGVNWQVFGAMVYTLPQSLPLIYTGEEIGLNRRLSFFEKDPITSVEWQNKSKAAWYKKMTALKHNVKALRNENNLNSWEEIYLVVTGNNEKKCYAYSRKNEESEAHVFLNFSSTKVSLKTSSIDVAGLKDYRTESNGACTIKDGVISMPPNSYIIYYK